MQEGSTYTGIQGLVAQDQAVTGSMGDVVDRSREHLAPEGQDWHEAYLENLERIVGPSWPGAAE